MAEALDPELVFDRLVVGAGNQLAVAAAHQAAEAPGRSYNPLVIHGPSGTGKTHLLSAIAHRAAEVDPGLRIHFERMDSLADRLASAIVAGQPSRVWREMGAVGMLLVDDLHLVAGKPRTQEELLRALDSMIRSGVQVVATATAPPHEIPALDERLVQRLSAGLTLDVAAPDDEFGSFLTDISTAVAAAVETTPETPQSPPVPEAEAPVDPWFLDREKFVWSWVSLDDRLIETLD